MDPKEIVEVNFIDFIYKWLSNPTVQKIAIAIAGFFVIILLIRLFKSVLSHRIKDPERRYRLRKIVSFIGYLIAIFFATAVFGEMAAYRWPSASPVQASPSLCRRSS